MIYEKLYNKLDKLGVLALIAAGAEAAKSEASGFMDLHFDRLYEDQGGIVISLAHYFEQNGDLCCDPDMEIRVYPDRGMAEALTFQQALPPIYTVVYPEPGKVDVRAKRDLNDFLSTWLTNAIAQGHHFTDGA